MRIQKKLLHFKLKSCFSLTRHCEVLRHRLDVIDQSGALQLNLSSALKATKSIVDVVIELKVDLLDISYFAANHAGSLVNLEVVYRLLHVVGVCEPHVEELDFGGATLRGCLVGFHLADVVELFDHGLEKLLLPVC